MAVPRFRSRSELKVPWVVKYAPQKLSEVAINPTKVKELEKAIQEYPVVVVSGPPGSSKSTVIKLIAEKLQYNVVEFSPPSSSTGFISIINAFKEFLLGVSFFDPNKTLVLVDELPNLIHDSTRQDFEETLIQYTLNAANLPKTVISFTEVEVSANYHDAIVVPRILGRLVALPRCQWVKANRISPRFMKKAIDRVCLQEGVFLSENDKTEMYEAGDIRSALTALEFYIKMKPKTSSQKNPVLLSSLLRSSTVNLFHAIGKIVYGSSNPASLAPTIEMFIGSFDTFNLTVLENYTNAFHQRLTMKTASDCAEWLSLGDTNPCLQTFCSLGVAEAIASSEPDTGLTKRFKKTLYTQSSRWRTEENEYRARIHQFAGTQTLPVSQATCALDLMPFSNMCTRELDLLSSDDDF